MLLFVKEVKDDEYYIEIIVIFEVYRGRGIVIKLLMLLFELNIYVKWSLNCDINNEVVLKLYKKVGFIFDGQIELYKYMYYYLIVK